MPNTNYAIHIKNSSGNLDVVVMRDPGVVPVDSGAAGQPRVDIPWIENNNATPVIETVSGATDATPIVLTVTGTTLVTGDFAQVSGVGGTTSANGTFEVSVAGNNVTLIGSDGNGAYTSGGKIRKLSKTLLYSHALEAAKRAILNDRAAGN